MYHICLHWGGLGGQCRHIFHACEQTKRPSISSATQNNEPPSGPFSAGRSLHRTVADGQRREQLSVENSARFREAQVGCKLILFYLPT